MLKKGFIFGVGAMLFVTAFAALNGQQLSVQKAEKVEYSDIVKQFQIDRIAKEVEDYQCKLGDKQLIEQKLNSDDIKRFREFCYLSTTEKIKDLEARFKKISESKVLESKFIAYDNSYSCTFEGYNWGIPTYQDLGLNFYSCGWHDSGGFGSPCRSQAGIACLWGCTNVDPALSWGFHTRYYSSKTALENDILRRGYQAWWAPMGTGYGAGYRRTCQWGLVMK